MFCFDGLSLWCFKYNEMVNIQQGLGLCDKTQWGVQGWLVMWGQRNEAKKIFLNADVGDKGDKMQI